MLHSPQKHIIELFLVSSGVKPTLGGALGFRDWIFLLNWDWLVNKWCYKTSVLVGDFVLVVTVDIKPLFVAYLSMVSTTVSLLLAFYTPFVVSNQVHSPTLASY